MTRSNQQRAQRAPYLVVVALAVVLLASALLVPACGSDDPGVADAHRVASRSELIGGPGALGEVGDFILQNDKVRFVIQDKGFSRGFGLYGGSLIDADLNRGGTAGDQRGGTGKDTFGELFPIFFLEALVPEKVEVMSDGSDGGPASIKVSGEGGDFLTLVKVLNQVLVNSHEVDVGGLLGGDPEAFNGDSRMAFETIYELDPGARFVRIRNRMINITPEPLAIPSAEGLSLLSVFLGGEIDMRVPLGTVLLYGAGNKVFAPGPGYNIRFGLDEAYQKEVPFPALPGLISDAIISSNPDGVSYGYFVQPTVKNFPRNRINPETGKNVYTETYGVDVEANDMLIPFLASAFTGVMFAEAPTQLSPAGVSGDTYEYVSYFVVGDGDVGSVMGTIHELREEVTSQISGIVLDDETKTPVEKASVLIYDRESGAVVNQFFTDPRGQFVGQMAPGKYTARVQKDPVLSPSQAFDLVPDKGQYLNLTLPTTGKIVVNVRDTEGRPLPAKVTIVGTVPPEAVGTESRDALFDLAAGERWRYTDFIQDKVGDPATLKYIETSGYTERGSVELTVPGDRDYTVYVSRGIEYDLQAVPISLEGGSTERVSSVLTRVVDTSGYIAADFHLHAGPSLDSDLPLDERLLSAAGEGLELAVSTDHNFVTDYGPVIDRLGMRDFMTSMVGLELTTLEGGHFNAYPMKYEPGSMTRGSFEWSLKTPDEVFSELRSRGSLGPTKTIVQVNHPRDSVLGYFAQHNLDPLTADIIPYGGQLTDIVSPNGPTFRDPETGDSTFSLDFDVIEVLNGKRFDQIRSYRMPASTAGLDIPAETRALLPEAGELLCDGSGSLVQAGAVDDWFNLLNQGMQLTGTGNSDSHHLEGEEPGYPRNYVAVGTDDPREITDDAVVNAVRAHKVVMTNGPFVELFVDGKTVGDLVEATGGKVDVQVKIQAPAWIGVNKGVVYVNGEEAHAFDVEMTDGRFTYETSLDLTKDSWLLVNVTGNTSLFPVIPPQEIPSIQISDAVASLAEPLGFGGGNLGGLSPPLRHLVTAYAITNPIWIDVDGGGFTAPGVTRLACADGEFATSPAPAPETMTDAQSLSVKRPDAGLKPSLWFPRIKGELHDVRVIFENFSGHDHH